MIGKERTRDGERERGGGRGECVCVWEGGGHKAEQKQTGKGGNSATVWRRAGGREGGRGDIRTRNGFNHLLILPILLQRCYVRLQPHINIIYIPTALLCTVFDKNKLFFLNGLAEV